jgi:hypothetical protein
MPFSSKVLWFFIGGDDEHGASPWAAAAQHIMAAPLPSGFVMGTATNEFHLLSDKESIPPQGRALVMTPDKSPTIPAGPFWIWAYMEDYNPAPAVHALNVTSYMAFFLRWMPIRMAQEITIVRLVGSMKDQ